MTLTAFTPDPIDTQILAAHLKEPHENHYYAWTDRLFQLLPYAAFAVRGSISGPDNRRYITAFVIDHENEPLYNFDALIHIAFEENAGIALVSGEAMSAAPDATIRYGGVWAYREYKHIGGCGNCCADYEEALKISPATPYDAKTNNDNQITLGHPSDEFFPPYIAKKLREEILRQFPNAAPSFNLLGQLEYALKYSIAVELNISTIPNDIRSKLAQFLTWYMPYYLPIVVMPDRS